MFILQKVDGPTLIPPDPHAEHRDPLNQLLVHARTVDDGRDEQLEEHEQQQARRGQRPNEAGGAAPAAPPSGAPADEGLSVAAWVAIIGGVALALGCLCVS